ESGVTLSTPITSGRPLARSPVSTVPAGAVPETDGAPRVAFAAVVLAAMAMSLSLSVLKIIRRPDAAHGAGPGAGLARGSREVKRRRKPNLGSDGGATRAAISNGSAMAAFWHPRSSAQPYSRMAERGPICAWY